MKILVCVKQVPDTTEVKIDPVKGTLIREGVPSILNPDDANALEAALQLKDKDPEGTSVAVLTMGPPQATYMLRECLAMGADEAYLLSDRVFGGADTCATSTTIAAGIRKVNELGKVDIIFAGRQAIDGDTAQVGPEIAEHLGLPQVTYALEAELTNDGLTILKECEDANQKIAVSLPCLVTFTKPSFDPRYPTIKRKLAANRAEIPVLGEDAFPDIDKTRIGLKGSPTHVKKSFVPPRKQGGVMIKEESNTASAQKLVAMLSEAHLI